MPSPDVEEKDARAHRGLGLRSSWRVRDWIGLRKGQEAWLLGHMRSRLQSNEVSGSDFRMEGESPRQSPHDAMHPTKSSATCTKVSSEL